MGGHVRVLHRRVRVARVIVFHIVVEAQLLTGEHIIKEYVSLYSVPCKHAISCHYGAYTGLMLL